jgi:hypothetical protein
MSFPHCKRDFISIQRIARLQSPLYFLDLKIIFHKNNCLLFINALLETAVILFPFTCPGPAWFLLFCAACLLLPVSTAQVVFVDINAAGVGTGTSWVDAHASI